MYVLTPYKTSVMRSREDRHGVPDRSECSHECSQRLSHTEAAWWWCVGENKKYGDTNGLLRGLLLLLQVCLSVRRSPRLHGLRKTTVEPHSTTQEFSIEWRPLNGERGETSFWMERRENKKKNDQLVGLRPPMCRENFPTDKQYANQLAILAHLQLLCAQRGKELGLSLRVVTANNRKLTHDFTTPIKTKFCSISRRLLISCCWFNELTMTATKMMVNDDDWRHEPPMSAKRAT